MPNAQTAERTSRARSNPPALMAPWLTAFPSSMELNDPQLRMLALIVGGESSRGTGLHCLTRRMPEFYGLSSSTGISPFPTGCIVSLSATDPDPLPLPFEYVSARQTLALLEEIVGYGSLEPGWDGPGSVAPSVVTLSESISLIFLILSFGIRLPEVSASADGYIDVYWKTKDGFVGINFKGVGKIAYFARMHGVVIAKGTDSYDLQAPAIPEELLEAIKQV